MFRAYSFYNEYFRNRFGGNGGASQALLSNNPGGIENPYQQPYLSRAGVITLGGGVGVGNGNGVGGGVLSDSPISNVSDDATLTDSELPFANHGNTSSNLHSSALPPLQNGKYAKISIYFSLVFFSLGTFQHAFIKLFIKFNENVFLMMAHFCLLACRFPSSEIYAN